MAGQSVATRAAEGKRERLPRESRGKQLLDIAEEHFVTLGFEATTLEGVVRAAGVSRPIVYEHYGSKEGLFLACAARARAEYEADYAHFLETTTATDIYDLTVGGGDVFFRMLESNPSRWALLFGSTTASSGYLADGLSRLRRGTISRIATLLKTRAPHVDDSALQACAFAISGVGEQLGHWWLLDQTVPRNTVVTYYANFITGALERLQSMSQQDLLP